MEYCELIAPLSFLLDAEIMFSLSLLFFSPDGIAGIASSLPIYCGTF
jgi:hypothetical protein